MNVWEALAAAAIVAYVIVRQLRGEPLRGKRLIVLPLVLTVVGVVDLGKHGGHLATADILCLAVGGLLAFGIGAGQGAMTRLEERDGSLWVRTPPSALWLWGALVVSRIVTTLVAHGLDAHVAASSAPVLMLLGVNRLGQAATVTPRALATGVPFAPEKDGRSFNAGGLLSGAHGGGGAAGGLTGAPRNGGGANGPSPYASWPGAGPAGRRAAGRDRRERRTAYVPQDPRAPYGRSGPR